MNRLEIKPRPSGASSCLRDWLDPDSKKRYRILQLSGLFVLQEIDSTAKEISIREVGRFRECPPIPGQKKLGVKGS